MEPEYFNKRRETRKQRFIDFLGGKCIHCGSKKNLQFDHIAPKTKKYDIADLYTRKEKDVLKEVKKCQLLCIDCHRKKTRENWEYTHPEAKHGTIWRYKKYKCRCDKCKKAMSDYYKSKLHL